MLNANDKVVYPLYPISTKSANNIRFRCGEKLLLIKNLPDEEDAKNLRKIRNEIAKKAKTISVLSVIMILVSIITDALLITTIGMSRGNILTSIKIGVLAAILLFFAILCLYYSRYSIAVKYATGKEAAAKYEPYFDGIYKRIAERQYRPGFNDAELFTEQLYNLAASAEHLWKMMRRINNRTITKIRLEVSTDKNSNLEFVYEYANGEGDLLEDYICLYCHVTYNINLWEEKNVLDLCDMTFRMGCKKNSDESLWEYLKTELFNTGYEAISEFVGYEYNPSMDKSAIEKIMDEIYQQMPDEDYDVFLTKYGLI